MKEISWNREYDVVVAGTGGAGCSAAIEAADNGASVVILEKSPFPGGGQTRTSGVGAAFAVDVKGAAEYLYAASRNGLENADPGQEISVAPKEDCLVFMEEMAKTPDWLAKMGVEHKVRVGTPAAYSFPGANSFGHVNIKGWGIHLLDSLNKQLEQRKVEVLFDTPAVELINDSDTGEIKGLWAENKGQRIAIKARKGVVLCTGGFEFDEEMKANYLRPIPLKFSGWPYNTGDGIKMAQKVGADLWHMNTMVGYLDIFVPGYKAAFLLRFGKGVWVNKYGRRYTNEGHRLNHNWWLNFHDYNIDEPGYEAVPSFLIFDEKIRKQGAVSGNSSTDERQVIGIQAYPVEMGGCPEGWSRDNLREIEKGWIKKAASIEELAALIGGKMEPAVLKNTIEKYNSYCQAGKDPEFGREFEGNEAIDTPPYYFCTVYPGGINTCGGPRRNGYGQVLDPFKKVIPRLYSAGEMGSICGIIYAIGGLNAGEMLASGRIAGRTAALMKSWE